MFKKIILATVLLGNTLLFGQTGSIKGKAFDEANAEGVAFVSVRLISDSGVIARTIADIDGNFTIGPINPGKYDLEIVSVGYSKCIKKGIVVNGKEETLNEIKMEMSSIVMICFDFIETVYEEYIISCGTGCSFTRCSYECAIGCCHSGCLMHCVGEDLFMSEADTTKIKNEKIIEPVVVACKAYPNPFTEYVVFELNSDSVSSANVPVLNLYDMTGKEVRSLNFSGTRAMIGRENLSSGIYTYHVSAAEKMISVGQVILR